MKRGNAVGFTTDANLLLYAVNEDSPFFTQAKHFVESCAQSADTWYLCWSVIHAFLRIATHPKIMDRPLQPAEAVAVVDQILQLPNVQTIGEDNPRFWDIYKNEVTAAYLRGSALSDAIICSTMKANGVSTIYTKDRDFLRFTGIKVVDPLK